MVASPGGNEVCDPDVIKNRRQRHKRLVRLVPKLKISVKTENFVKVNDARGEVTSPHGPADDTSHTETMTKITVSETSEPKMPVGAH